MEFLSSIFGADTPKTATPAKETAKPATLTPVGSSATSGPPIVLATPKEPEKPVSSWMDSKFIERLKWHETQRDTPEVQMKMIGDKGKAHGWLQQHEINVENANEILAKQRRIIAQNWAKNNKVEIGSKDYIKYLDSLPASVKYSSLDRLDPVKSIEIYDVNMKDLVPKLEKMLGRKLTDTELARAHNAGTVERFKGNQIYGQRYDESIKKTPPAKK